MKLGLYVVRTYTTMTNTERSRLVRLLHAAAVCVGYRQLAHQAGMAGGTLARYVRYAIQAELLARLETPAGVRYVAKSNAVDLVDTWEIDGLTIWP